MIKEDMCITTERSEKIHQLLKAFEFWKATWIIYWIKRYFENWKHKRDCQV